MRRPLISAATIAVVLAGLAMGNVATACPFCPQVAKTFSEEFSTSDVVAVVKLLKPPPPPALTASGSVDSAALAKFEVVEVLKGAEHVKVGHSIATAYFGQGKPGETFLLMGADPQQILWTTPLKVGERAVAYFKKLGDLPAEGVERLMFFQNHLEDSEDLLARDAFDEFARAPYDAVRELAPHMNHDQLVAWIHEEDIPASRRRLYLTMLGVCGTESDLPMLEAMLKSDDRKSKAGLDAMIACYLTLGGAERLAVIDELFLKNKEAEYADTYAAIMALRFHGTEGNVIPRTELVKSLRYMLERPKLADLVIPDLAKWEDWQSMEKLVALFKSSDEESNWVRVPVINYLRACPLAEAKEHLKDLEQIDPASFKRANTFFPGGAAPAPKPVQSSEASGAEEVPMIASSGASMPPRAARGPQPALAAASTGDTPQLASISRAPPAREPDFLVNRWQIASVLAGCGLALGLAMWSLLRTHASPRSPVAERRS